MDILSRIFHKTFFKGISQDDLILKEFAFQEKVLKELDKELIEKAKQEDKRQEKGLKQLGIRKVVRQGYNIVIKENRQYLLISR